MYKEILAYNLQEFIKVLKVSVTFFSLKMMAKSPLQNKS